MSGLVSAITKIFSSIGGGLATGAATLGSAVRGVGASLFTGMAATGSGIGGTISNLFSGATSTLGNMINGALNVVGLSPTASALTGAGGADSLIGSATGDALGATSAVGATGATGLGSALGPGVAGSGAGAWTTALKTAATPTGLATGGAASSTDLLLANALKDQGNNTLLAGLIGGAGAGLQGYMESQAIQEENQRNRDFQTAAAQKITDSYHIDPSALVGGTSNPLPAANRQPQQQAQWVYNQNTGRVEKRLMPAAGQTAYA